MIAEKKFQSAEGSAVALGEALAVSVLIPAKDEAANLPALLTEIAGALPDLRFEIIIIDDGSTDETGQIIGEAAKTLNLPLLLLTHEKSAGKSRALFSGLQAASGEIIVTLDGDGQNDPRAIPALLAALQRGGPSVAMAAGRRTGRTDGIAKRLASKAANRLRRVLLGDYALDSGCGMKAIRREIFLKLPFFDNSHRFFPALINREGYELVNVDIIDRPRLHGNSKYGIIDRALASAIDLFGVWWLCRRACKRPAVAAHRFMPAPLRARKETDND